MLPPFFNQNLKQRVFGTQGFMGIFENSWNGCCSFHACRRIFSDLLRYWNGFQGCCSFDFDSKQLFCSQFEPVLDWLYECEGGLLDCGCTRRHWTDPWLGNLERLAWFTVVVGSDCTLDET